MRNGWIKYFTELVDPKTTAITFETGYDEDVKNKTASWSRGRLDNIDKVTLFHEHYKIAITGDGNYWQSDTYNAVFGQQPQLVKRRIEKQILEDDLFFEVLKLHNDKTQYLTFLKEKDDDFDLLVPIDKFQIGKWLIFELNLVKNNISYYFSNNRI